MSISDDSGFFFQTESALAIATRKAAKAANKHGDPIQLGSKLLDIIPDPTNPQRIYVAESGSLVRRINIETGKTLQAYRGHTAPSTSLALNASGSILFGGSWDKTVISWNADTAQELYRFVGHTDFIKSILHIPCPSHSPHPQGVLLSGSSDTFIIVWDVASGKRLHTLKGHMRGVNTLALDPIETTEDIAVVYSAGSERCIRKWKIPLRSISAAAEAEFAILEHDTSINKITFESDDLWTASADCTARRLSINDPQSVPKNITDTVLQHPDYVNDVVVEPRGLFVITACRDENIRIWDIVSGKLHHTFVGHADAVTSLAIVGVNGDLISASIDGTLRKWTLGQLGFQSAKRTPALGAAGIPSTPKMLAVLTEEEERELEKLMEEAE